MLSFKDKQITYDHCCCQQCGVCQAVCPENAISLKLLDNGLHEVSIDSGKCIHCQKCIKVCPANRPGAEEDYCEAFCRKEYFLGYNMDKDIRRRASSGGVCRTLIIEGLKNNLIDGVYSLRKCSEYPYAEGTFYTKDNLPNYEDIPNSIYHSVMIGNNLGKVQKCKRLMIVGTSCQLWALEKALKGKYEELIKVCIFCKQQKTLDSTRFLAKVMGVGSINTGHSFHARYRGMGWPGIVLIKGAELPWNRAAQLPFGRRLWTVPGCNICADPFGVSARADISLMDPWSIRVENKSGETLISVHTPKGRNLVLQTPGLTLKSKKYAEVLPALDLTDVWQPKHPPTYRATRPHCFELQRFFNR